MIHWLIIHSEQIKLNSNNSQKPSQSLWTNWQPFLTRSVHAWSFSSAPGHLLFPKGNGKTSFLKRFFKKAMSQAPAYRVRNKSSFCWSSHCYSKLFWEAPQQLEGGDGHAIFWKMFHSFQLRDSSIATTCANLFVQLWTNYWGNSLSLHY